MNSKMLISTHVDLIPSAIKDSSNFYRFSTPSLVQKSTVRVSCSSSNIPHRSPKSFDFRVKHAAAAFILAAAAFGSFPFYQCRAEILSPSTSIIDDLCAGDVEEESNIETPESSSVESPLTQLLESDSKAIDALRILLLKKLEAGEDEEGLTILRHLSSAQPENNDWKFLMAKVLNENGKVEEARQVFEEILGKTPFSFEALFENALLMDRSGEGDSVIRRLETALNLAETEKKAKEARNVRLIMAQMHFLQKNLDVALKNYEELIKEDPNDFRPYFCKGMIFSLMDKNTEAREEFAKFRKLSPKKFDVEGYLRTPLSQMKLFGTDEEN